MNGKASSSPILGYSFLASVLINMGWVAWVAHSSVFGSAVTMTQLHERPIRIFKPVPVKPRPKPKTVTPLPPPPPPKEPKVQPEIKPLRPVLHLRPVSHMTPRPPQQPIRHMQTVSQVQPRQAPVFQAPSALAPPAAARRSVRLARLLSPCRRTARVRF